MDASQQEPTADQPRDDIFWVHDLGWDGRGVARRSDGRVIFIWGALPGDSVRADVVDDPPKGPLSGELRAVLEPSPQRVPHPCPHYYEGCPASLLGAVRREFSLNWKRDHLVETFRRIGGFEGVLVEDVIPSPRQWRYRERLEFTMQRIGELLKMGYQTRDGLLPIQDCRLGGEELVGPYRQLRRALPMLDEHPHLGEEIPLRLLIRANGRGQAVAVVFVIGKEVPDLDPLVAWLGKADLVGWQIRLSKSVKRRYFGSKLIREEGETTVYQTIVGHELPTEPISFAQANVRASKLLVRLALEHVTPESNLLDLYGGYGAFGLEHALRGGRATVVDSSPSGIEAGRAFASEHNLPVDYVAHDLGKTEGLEVDFSKYDAILLDPPRSGVEQQMLELLDNKGPSRVVYVSCHPAALARDLRRMKHYTTSLIIPVDMFPSTSDLETIAVLDRA